MTMTEQKLVFEGGRWQTVQADLAAPVVDGIEVEATAALIPANVYDGAFWVGHLPGQADSWVGGWGPLVNRVVCRRDTLLTLPATDAPAALGLLALAAIHTALRPLLPVERVGLLGEGTAAALLRTYLRHHSIALTSEPAHQSLDLLIDVTGDVALWGPALATVATEGAALLLGAARQSRGDYNFYPDIHRRSLKLVSRGWHTSVEPTAIRELAALAAPAAAILRDGRWVQPLSTRAEGENREAWQLVEWARVQ